MRKLFFSLLILYLFPFVSFANPANIEMMQQQDPGSELWRAVRGHKDADFGDVRSQVQGMETGVLVNKAGDEWRLYRMQEFIPLAGKIIGGVAILILLFRLLRGRIAIKAGRSTQKIKRFSGWQRFVHWLTAILFVGLGITGMFLLFGRELIMPHLGPNLGGDVMLIMKRIHDFSSPVFVVALALLILTFIKGNFPHWRDIIWVLKGGGLFGGHAPAGRYNAGEKAWYWVAGVVGIGVAVSGMVMLFPNLFAETRNEITYFHWMHSLAALILIVGAMGHIYMGTLAMEGAFECMATGYCDANWAKEHHDVWYEEMREKGQLLTADQVQTDHVQAEQAIAAPNQTAAET